jgi:hypothetical protein
MNEGDEGVMKKLKGMLAKVWKDCLGVIGV